MVKRKPNSIKLNQEGFIPLLVTVLLIVAVLVYLAYTRVLHARGGI